MVGELTVDFNAAGDVITCFGTPHLLLSDTFQRDKVELTGAARDAVLKAVADAPELSTASGRSVMKLPVEEYSTQQFIDKDGVLR